MPKNIVVCLDGTGNQFGQENSNVVKLYQVLERGPHQVAYYHPGVGTMGARNALTTAGKTWTRVLGLAFGYGLSENICDAYQFLMREYELHDRVYVFGFSRGAYTARVLCGMLYALGLLTRGNEAQIPYAIRLLKQDPVDFAVAAQFKATFSRECKPHFLGVWDTVSSVGWVYQAVTFPFTRATSNPDLNIVRHAMAIDERRAFFRQNLFGPQNHSRQDVRELWFAGVHSDVGGSYPEAESQLSKIALQWMLEEAEVAQLAINAGRKADVLGGKPPYVKPDATTENQHESLHGWWLLAELWPKVVRMQGPDGKWRRRLRVNLGRRRYLADDAVLHPSVELRLRDAKKGYRPKNLPGAKRHAQVTS